MLKGKCKSLFIELRDFSDNLLAMRDFVELLKEWVDWNRGEIRIALINLNDYGFPEEEMFIAYDDMSGCTETKIYRPFEFIELMIDVFDEYDDEDDEEYFEEFWIPRLEGLIEDNDY